MVAGAPPEANFLAETPLRMLRSALSIGVYLELVGGFLALFLSSFIFLLLQGASAARRI
jgi:hypothetical protein